MAKNDATENSDVDLDDDIDKTGGAVDGEDGKNANDDGDTGKGVEGDSSLNSNDDDHEGDADIAANATDSERAEIQKRRKAERLEKRQKQREREESMRRRIVAQDNQLREANERLSKLEMRGQQVDMGTVDAELRKTADAYTYYKGQIELAVKNADGAAAAEATEKMMLASRKAEQLVQLKNAAERGGNQPSQIDPRTTSLQQGWLAKNSWFDITNPGTDTRIAVLIDNEVMNDGFRPNTPEYWEELDVRLKKRLPHRYISEHTPNNASGRVQNKSIAAGSGKDSGEGSATGKSFVLSAERKAALQEAGLWSDQKKREAAIARFRKYDADQQSKGAQS